MNRESGQPGRQAKALVRALPLMHKAKVGTCRCGACSHQLRRVEVIYNLPTGSLRESLAKYDPPRQDRSRPRVAGRRRLTAQVSQTATVRRGGEGITLAEALALLGTGSHTSHPALQQRRVG